MKTHSMSLNPNAFRLIETGIKTIEMRLYDEKRQEISKGDGIIFISTEDEEKSLKVKVKEIHKYKGFDELYKEFDKLRLGYDKDDFASPKDMKQYYSKEDIKKYGVVGIEVEVINII